MLLKVDSCGELSQPWIICLIECHDAKVRASETSARAAKVRGVECIKEGATNLKVVCIMDFELFKNRSVKERMDCLPDVVKIRVDRG